MNDTSPLDLLLGAGETTPVAAAAKPEPPPFEPGIHYDMPAERYHATEALSASGAKEILRSAMHYRYLFGHARIAGRISEQVLCGQSFVRVDVPQVRTIAAHTRSFGADAIYSGLIKRPSRITKE